MVKNEGYENEIVFCDDSRPMQPHPPLTENEQQRHDEFWSKMDELYFRTATPT